METREQRREDGGTSWTKAGGRKGGEGRRREAERWRSSSSNWRRRTANAGNERVQHEEDRMRTPRSGCATLLSRFCCCLVSVSSPKEKESCFFLGDGSCMYFSINIAERLPCTCSRLATCDLRSTTSDAMTSFSISQAGNRHLSVSWQVARCRQRPSVPGGVQISTRAASIRETKF